MKSRVLTIAVGLAVLIAAVLLGLVYWHRPKVRRVAAPPSAVMPAGAQALLHTYFARAQRQAMQLAGYSDLTIIHAKLPRVMKSGEFRVERQYTAPRQLKFVPLHYTGNGFVKDNVILGYLSRETAHVRKGEEPDSAITPENYEFTYLGQQRLQGTPVTAFAVQPREVREGLFAGRIYLNPSSGHLVRAEGRFVESPSLFVETLQFVQDYASFDGFDLPTYIHSDSDTHLAGHAVMDIYHRDYQVTSAG